MISQHLGDISLRELAVIKHLIQGTGQAQLGLTLGGVGKPEIYRIKVTQVATALREPDSRAEAAEALRGLVDAIVLTPGPHGETLKIEWRGHLAAMLGHRTNEEVAGIRRPLASVFEAEMTAERPGELAFA